MDVVILDKLESKEDIHKYIFCKWFDTKLSLKKICKIWKRDFYQDVYTILNRI